MSMGDHKPNPTILFFAGVVIGLLAITKFFGYGHIAAVVIAVRHEPLFWLWCAALVVFVLPVPIYFKLWKKRHAAKSEKPPRSGG